jgi:hypothetical protein
MESPFLERLVVWASRRPVRSHMRYPLTFAGVPSFSVLRGALLLIEQTLATWPKRGPPTERPPPPAGRYDGGVQACGKVVRHPAVTHVAGGGQRHMIRRNVGMAPQRRLL